MIFVNPLDHGKSRSPYLSVFEKSCTNKPWSCNPLMYCEPMLNVLRICQSSLARVEDCDTDETFGRFAAICHGWGKLLARRSKLKRLSIVWERLL